MARIDYELERIMDSHGTMEVLQIMSAIASEKAEHVMASYGDVHLARKWSRASRALDSCAHSKGVRGVS
jgi:hypothetical protein